MTERVIRCVKCGEEMTRANVSFTDVWAKKGSSIFDGESRSTLACYVCLGCGYCEFYADKYKEFKK